MECNERAAATIAGTAGNEQHPCGPINIKMTTKALPDCHNYPKEDYKFMTVSEFQEFKKFFCHMRNATFQSYNNSASSLYLCPNYKHCRGVLHGLRRKNPRRDADGNLVYDKNGYLKYDPVPCITVGPITRPCDCHPTGRCTDQEGARKIFDRMLNLTNVSRAEFTNLANSYFAVAGKGNFSFKDTGNHVTWNAFSVRPGNFE